MGRRVKAARGKRARFDKLLLRVRMHGRIMSNGHEPAVPFRAEADSLDGPGAHAYVMEDLPPRQRDFHRLVQATRGDCGQNGLGVDAQLGSETAANVGAHNLDSLRIDFQRAGHRTARGIDDLGAELEHQIFAARHGQARIRLHGLGKVIRRIVLAVDLDRSTTVSRIEISHSAVSR
jgi:hypothetical protein